MKLAMALSLLVVILVVVVLYILSIRPEQAPVTAEILELKETDEDMYLSFIADNLQSGGVPKDAIPAIDEPQYATAEEVMADGLIADDAIVFGVAYEGFVAAYPQDILYWHEIVNEEIETAAGSEKLSLTYCPLTGTPIGYKGKNLGVSGLLYNSNLVFYDRESGSNYPQVLGKAVEGSEKGASLETFPVVQTTWGQWRQTHPGTLLLTRETGHDRDYDRTPYPGYDDALRIWFPVAAEDDRFHSKKIILGIEHQGEAFALVKESVEDSIEIQTENGVLTVTRDSVTDGIIVVDENGMHVKSFDAYWFAWFAYHPDTQVIGGA